MMRKVLIALLLCGLLGLGRPVGAFSGGEPPPAAEILERAELILIGRVVEELGTVDLPGGGIYTLHRLEVESYIRPAAPGPDSLVVSTIGGMGLYRAMDGPGIGPHRSLFFLRRSGDHYVKAAGVLTPTIPLEGERFAIGAWEDLRAALQPLLEEPRHPAHPAPAVRLNGRQIGWGWLREGRSYLPAARLEEALGRAVAALPAGDLGLVPLRSAAERLGMEIRWDEAGWAVELTWPEAPEPAGVISKEQAVDGLVRAVEAIMAESKGGNSFADSFAVAAARFYPRWLDPVSGAERPVWVLEVWLRGASGPFQEALVDGRTGELRFVRLVRKGSGGEGSAPGGAELP